MVPIASSFLLAVTVACGVALGADEPVAPGSATGERPATKQAEVPLSTRQEAVAVRFRRFENTLLQLAEYLRRTDPDRAELLIRAIGQSQEKRIQQQMRDIVTSLAKGEVGDAILRQDDLTASLISLLQLLQSEDRRSELEAEKERLQKLVKNVGRLIGKQKDARAANERGDSPQNATDRQQKVEQDTEQLLEEIKQHDGQNDADQKDTSQQPPDKGTESPDSNAKNSEHESPESLESSPPDQSETSDAARPPSSDNAPPQTPGREQLEKARDQMQQALEKLQQQQRDQASENQDEAIRKLIEAKDKLEEILRQLREEERGLLLTALEARFRKMLAMQQLIYHQTVELNAVPDAERSARQHERARKLSFDERAIGLDVDKALALLQEDGTSVAFPQALEEIRIDVTTVAERLEKHDVGALTQSIEQSILDALEEMIEAFQRELEKQQEQQEQQQQEQQPNEQPPLMDMLSEVKMLRTLQVRINRRTERLGKLIDGNQATDADVVQQLQELARRQQRVQRATYDLVTGRNR